MTNFRVGVPVVWFDSGHILMSLKIMIFTCRVYPAVTLVGLTLRKHVARRVRQVLFARAHVSLLRLCRA